MKKKAKKSQAVLDPSGGRDLKKIRNVVATCSKTVTDRRMIQVFEINI